MPASALPKERRRSEICIKIYKKRKKNTSNVFDHDLKNNYQILIIFGTNISDTTCYKTIV